MGRFGVREFLQTAPANSHRYERLGPILLIDVMRSTTSTDERRGDLMYWVTGGKPPQMIGPETRRSGISCPRCGGMLAAELAAAMNELVCEQAVIEAPHCHCEDVDGSHRAGSRPEEKANRLEPASERMTPESRTP